MCPIACVVPRLPALVMTYNTGMPQEKTMKKVCKKFATSMWVGGWVTDLKTFETKTIPRKQKIIPHRVDGLGVCRIKTHIRSGTGEPGSGRIKTSDTANLDATGSQGLAHCASSVRTQTEIFQADLRLFCWLHFISFQTPWAVLFLPVSNHVDVQRRKTGRGHEVLERGGDLRAHRHRVGHGLLILPRTSGSCDEKRSRLKSDVITFLKKNLTSSLWTYPNPVGKRWRHRLAKSQLSFAAIICTEVLWIRVS